MAKARVCVLIPCHNYGHYLSETLRSVFMQKGDDISLQVIVIDDGSRDNTREIAERFPHADYVYQEQKGVSAARNAGLKRADGDYVLFLDADDLLPANILSLQIANLKAHPQASLSVSRTVEYNEEHQAILLRFLFSDTYPVHLACANIAPPVAFLLRHSCAVSSQFEERRKCFEDYLYFLDCLLKGHQIIGNPKAFVIYRKHKGSALSRYAQKELNEEKPCRIVGRMLREKNPFFPLSPESLMANTAGCLYTCQKTQKNALRSVLLEEVLSNLKSFRRSLPITNKDVFSYYLTLALAHLHDIDLTYAEKVSQIKTLLASYSPYHAELPYESLVRLRISLLQTISFSDDLLRPALSAFMPSLAHLKERGSLP